MANERRISLERVRTDGWFERLSESIGSFHTLCDVLGERFFAFALIVGARVSSLMIDRFNPDQSLVEFSFAGPEGEGDGLDSGEQRLTVVEFRERLVEALLAEEELESATPAQLDDDLEVLQRHIGPRLLLLAPLYGYCLQELVAAIGMSSICAQRDGQTETLELGTFRARMMDHVKEELERGVQRNGGTAIDLNRVGEAEAAAEAGDWDRVVELLGGWPMPLAIYWRTPEGQMLPDHARQRIAEGLGLLGTACSKLGDETQGEEVLRLAVQYAQDGPAAATIFLRMGQSQVDAQRYGEAIGTLRRALATGAAMGQVLPSLATSLCESHRGIAALGALELAREADVSAPELDGVQDKLERELGPALERWRALVHG